MAPVRTPGLWGLGADEFSMRGSPCVDAGVCKQGGMADTVCCRVAGKQYPGFCLGPSECVARGATYDEPAAGDDAERRRALVRGLAIAGVVIGLVYLTVNPKKRR
jgi:hypothetical protein